MGGHPTTSGPPVPEGGVKVVKKIVDIWWISFQKTLDRSPQMSGLHYESPSGKETLCCEISGFQMKHLFRVREQNKSQEIKKYIELHRSKMGKLQVNTYHPSYAAGKDVGAAKSTLCN